MKNKHNEITDILTCVGCSINPDGVSARFIPPVEDKQNASEEICNACKCNPNNIIKECKKVSNNVPQPLIDSANEMLASMIQSAENGEYNFPEAVLRMFPERCASFISKVYGVPKEKLTFKKPPEELRTQIQEAMGVPSSLLPSEEASSKEEITSWANDLPPIMKSHLQGMLEYRQFLSGTLSQLDKLLMEYKKSCTKK